MNVLKDPLRRFLSGVLSAAGLLIGTACGSDLDEPSQVTDLRVLAIRADPPELLVKKRPDGAGLEVSGGGRVKVQALVLDPRGGSVRYTWQACAQAADELCAQASDAAASFREPDASNASIHAADEGATPSVPEGSAALDQLPVPTFHPTFGAPVAALHLERDGFGGNGAWLNVVLRVRNMNGNDAQALAVRKRVVMNAENPLDFRAEMQDALGLDVCASEAQTRACLALPERTANRNPEVEAVQVAQGAQADGRFETLEGPLVLTPGQTVRLLPVIAARHEEVFNQLESGFEDNRLAVVAKREEMVVSWFSTLGSFEENRTSRLLTKTLDNIYEAPDSLASDRAEGALWMVVRDQRGGTAWRGVRVVIQEHL